MEDSNNNNQTNGDDRMDITTAAAASDVDASMEEMIDILSKDMEMIRFVESRVASILGIEEDRKLPAKKNVDPELSKRVLRNILSNKKTKSGLKRATRSRSRSPLSIGSISSDNVATVNVVPPPLKTVSFSSVSTAPLVQEEEDVVNHGRRSSSISPPPPTSYSPPLSSSTSPISRIRTTGEDTASGDSSSVISLNSQQQQPTTSQHQVHFSAMNPNPQLLLVPNTENNAQQQRAVTFTFDTNVSFVEDNVVRTNVSSYTGSRTSSLRASGRSSPSIEPALSPIARTRSPSRSNIQFNLDTMEVITEAAARLRREQNVEEDIRPKVVHFSARRETVHTNTQPVSNDDNPHPVVHFAEDNEDEELVHIHNTHTEAEMERVANRLRHLIRRAEEIDNITLEDAFVHFDRHHTGTITAHDLQTGLTTLGFHDTSFTLYECEVLLSCLTRFNGIHHTRGINLLGFYRAMGRRSPPPLDDDAQNEQLQHDLTSSHVIHAYDAASRLRAIILSQPTNTLESYFRLFDTNNTGHITAEQFRIGLQSIVSNDESNNSFSILSNDDCEELVNLFDTNKDGLVSLVDFYRFFMGRRSPPPPTVVSDDNHDGVDEEDGDSL